MDTDNVFKIDNLDEVDLPELTCKRCAETWNPRTKNPEVCPTCKSRKWNGGEDPNCEIYKILCQKCGEEFTPRGGEPEVCSHCKNGYRDEEGRIVLRRV